MSLLKNKTTWLIILLLIGVILRFYDLSQADSYTDEAILGFRAIGLIDYNAAYTQTTPWQWFDQVPAWAHLSFHDHPPVFFWLEHWSINIFGQNTFALRLPVALAGMVSLYLVFLITRRLIDERAAFISLALLAVQSHHVWISRIGLQDSVVLFFILLAVWLWLLALERQKLSWWLWWGLSLGLGIMTKYTALIVVFICLAYAIIFKISFYKNKHFWLSALLALIVVLPIILYNWFLYGAVEHFDFQISALLHQNTPNWAVRLGREKVGGLGDRFIGFFTVFYRTSSWLFNILAALSWLSVLLLYIRNRSRVLLFLVIVPVLLWLWFLIIGSTDRFVVMILPWLVILISYIFSELWEIFRHRRLLSVLFILLLVLEISFTINSFFLSHPYGQVSWAYAQTSETNQNFGFNQLDVYLDKMLQDKYAAASGEPQYNFLSELKDNSIAKAKAEDKEPWPVIIIYDYRIFSAAKLWTLTRRLIYDGWIIMPDTTFVSITGDKLADYYREQGVEDFIYIVSLNSENYPADPASIVDDAGSGQIIEDYINSLGIEPDIITNGIGQPAFAVYKF